MVFDLKKYMTVIDMTAPVPKELDSFAQYKQEYLTMPVYTHNCSHCGWTYKTSGADASIKMKGLGCPQCHGSTLISYPELPKTAPLTPYDWSSPSVSPLEGQYWLKNHGMHTDFLYGVFHLRGDGDYEAVYSGNNCSTFGWSPHALTVFEDLGMASSMQMNLGGQGFVADLFDPLTPVRVNWSGWLSGKKYSGWKPVPTDFIVL